ncbi:hypothetical protein niasHT_033470 [Heterodera trifolii]|uniref:RING-type domain-containing protein n=1 Tax=Heterodera trifolii TaxID=157864 RepID=A0ABD2J441_9BILA
MMAFKCHFVLSLWLFFCASSFLVYGGGKDASSGSNHSDKKSLADLMVEERLADRDGKPLNELLKFDKIDKNELDAFLKENEQLLDIAFADYNPQNVQLGDHAQSETPSKSNKKKASMGEQMLKKLKEKLIRLFAVKKNDPVMAQIMENLFSFIKKIIKGESPQNVKHYLLFTIKIFALRERISLSENMPKNKIEKNHLKLFKMVLEESNEQKEGNSERRKTILTSLYDEVGSLEIPSGIEIKKSQKKGKRKSRRKKRVADIVFSLLFALAIIIAMCAWHWAKYKINEYKTKQKGLKINANLPKHTIDEENSGDCPICLAKFEVGDEFPELQCKHKFHTECIGQWLKMQNTCPYCRATTENASKGKANAQGQPQQLPRGK